MLPSLNLDDLTYQQLADILRAHIPGDEWSDHNPSDPGIALMELLSWLGEMDLYRMNRVPAAHRNKFLKLLLDPPTPVTVMVTLGLVPTRVTPLVVPAGLRVASDYRGGRRTVLESFAPVTLVPGPTQQGTVRMRAVRDLLDVPLGISDGAPNQTFALPDGPVLLDLASATSTYNPNPQVRVGATPWELHPFLLTAASQGSPAPNHFMVEDFEGRVRFGDGTFGAIPPAGAAITLIAAQVLEGSAALVAAGDVHHVLNPGIVLGLAPASLVVAANADAQGGDPSFPSSSSTTDDRVRRGLEEFRNPTRLITAADFERVTSDDFNEFQGRFNAAVGLAGTDLIGRATALMNRRPPLLDAPAPGHVTLMVLPVLNPVAFAAAPLATKVMTVTPSPALHDRLLAFLDPRRLITTRLDVIGPDLKELSAQVVVVQQPQSNAAQIAQAVQTALRGYLDITTGADDGRGWPLGRPVRRSQLYRLLEGIAGVDYVQTLTLSPANAQGDVDLGARELPVWGLGTALDIQVKRI